MKNYIKRFLCLLLAISTFCFVVACGKDNSSTDSVPADESIDDNTPVTGTHEFNYTETDSYLFKDGATDYVIVTPETTTLEANYAKTELVNLFRETTGITLSAITDKNLSHNAANKYISLGRTTLFETSGLEDKVDADELKRDGVRILTKDKTIFFVGGTSDYGVLYGVYDFLEMHFGFDVYFKSNYSLKKDVKELKLYNYDVKDVPDIEYRSRASGAQNESTSQYDDRMFSYRTRSRDTYWSMLLPINGYREHNSIRGFFPKEIYEDENPEFYGGGQLCYTAHGNKEKYDLMVSIAAEKIEESLRANAPDRYPDICGVQIGIEDNNNMCACEACSAMQKKYNNSATASIIKFVKDVGRAVDKWMCLPENKAYRRDDFAYMFFAYWGTEHSPYTYDEASGKYVAADNEVFPEDVNIKPFVAIQTLDHGKPLSAPSNAASAADMISWMNVFPNSWFWSYGSAYNDYFCFVDNYSFYSELFPLMAQNNVQMSLIQQHSSQRGSDTGFFNLSAYVDCKLRWNTSLKIDEVINKYFDGMYREAAEEMKEYYMLCKLWFADAFRSERVWSNSITGRTEYFDIGTIKAMFKKLDEAYEAIEIYSRDEVLYDKLKTNIDSEWLFPAKTAIGNNFEDYFTSSQLSAMKAKFKSVCIRIGLTNAGESSDLAGFLNTL